MSKKSTLLSLIMIVVLGTDAYAGGIGGWGFTITGSALTVDIDIFGVGNASKKPSIAIVDADLQQIEYLCLNPNDFNVAPGSAGSRTVNLVDVIDSGNIVENGKTLVDITFDIPGPFPCVNPNWTFLLESEAAKVILTTIAWFACTGDPNTDPEPCFNGNVLTIEETPKDQVEGVCTLNPVQRNPDGTVILGQEYACVQTSP